MNSTIVIVPEQYAASSNQLALQHFDSVGGLSTFVNPLVTLPDTTTITHRWCCAPFSPEKRALLNQLAPLIPGILITDFDIDNAPGTPFEFLATNGLAPYAPPMFTQP
jgi:hypothetical protein